MQFHLIVAWFHVKLCTKNDGRGLLWPIARKRYLIRLRQAAFFTVFVRNLVHAYKFLGNLKTSRSIFLKMKARKVIKWRFKCQILCLFTVFMTLKTFSKYFQNALIEFVQTLPQPRQLRDVQAPFSDF